MKGKMTRRERVLTSLKHSEPDRVPVDLGAMDSTGITGMAYNRLKKYLGIKSGNTRVFEPYQQVVIVEPEVLEAVGADVMAVPFLPRNWKPWKLPDGSPCEIPEKWSPVELPDGSQVVYGKDGSVSARMPKNGFYFEQGEPPLAKCESVADIEKNIDCIKNFDLPDFWDEPFVETGKRAQNLRQKTDYALMGIRYPHLCRRTVVAGI